MLQHSSGNRCLGGRSSLIRLFLQNRNAARRKGEGGARAWTHVDEVLVHTVMQRQRLGAQLRSACVLPFPSSSTCVPASVLTAASLRTVSFVPALPAFPHHWFLLLPCVFMSRYPSAGSLCDLAMLLVFTVSFYFLYCHGLFFPPFSFQSLRARTNLHWGMQFWKTGSRTKEAAQEGIFVGRSVTLQREA